MDDEGQNMTEGDEPKIIEYEAGSLAEYLAIVKKISDSLKSIQCWFRGHAEADWRLAPSIFRANVLGDDLSNVSMDGRMINLRNIETITSLDFLHQANTREEKFPDRSDYIGQLVVARHHGLLSRLMDWSESPLTALFFAVEIIKETIKPKRRPACVWILEPTMLNKAQWSEEQVYYSHAPVPMAMARCAFNGDFTLQGILIEIETEKIVSNRAKIGKVSAFQPHHTIPRHMVQRAQFTIHNTPTALDELQEASNFW